MNCKTSLTAGKGEIDIGLSQWEGGWKIGRDGVVICSKKCGRELEDRGMVRHYAAVDGQRLFKFLLFFLSLDFRSCLLAN